MDISHFLPSKDLIQHIDRYWLLDSCPTKLLRLLPGTGLELWVHLGNAVTCSNSKGIRHRLPLAHCVCLRRNSYTVECDSKTRILAVRFRAGAFRHFCKIPITELNDSFQDITTIWGSAGNELAEQVSETTDTAVRISLLEKVLRNYLATGTKSYPTLDETVKRLYYNYASFSLEKNALLLNFSKRHFQRIFKQEIGVTPAFFHRVARFQQTVKTLVLQRQKEYLATALSNGYYDQSHFIKDCHYFLGEKPSSCLAAQNFLSHFYNPRLVNSITLKM